MATSGGKTINAASPARLARTPINATMSAIFHSFAVAPALFSAAFSMPLWVATAIPRVQIGTVSIGANVIQLLPMSFRKSAHAAEVIILITVTVSPFVGLITDTPIVPRMQDAARAMT